MFSQVQALNRNKDPEGFEARLKKAEKHMEFAVKMYRIQLKEGRYFIHEHPAGAISWRMEVIKKLWGEEGVRAVVADQCEYGLMSRDRWGSAPAKKPTRFLTNSWHAAEAYA